MSEAEQKKNARNAMIVMFKDQKGRLFIPEAYAERKNPTLLFSKFISFHQRYELHQAAIEDVGFQRTLKFPLFYAMREVNYTFSVTEQAPIASKHARIRTLAPYVEAHMVYLRKGAPGIKDLVDELKSFPIAGTVDLLDAAAACLPLFGLVKAEEGRNMYRIRRAVGDEERRLATRSGITGY